MLPKPLQPYAEALKKYEKPCITILPIRVSNSDDFKNDPLELQQSKFGGTPFFPKTMDYPKDSYDAPMVMVAQINFVELPDFDGFPQQGLLQLYLAQSYDYDKPEYKVIYITPEALEEEPCKDFSFLTDYEDYQRHSEETYDTVGLDRIHALAFNKRIDRSSSQDQRFDLLFDGMDRDEFIFSREDEKEFEALVNYLEHNTCKIGGYAHKVWEDDYFLPTVKPKHPDDTQLLQISYADYVTPNYNINLFISPKDLKNKRFEKAYLV